ITEDPLRAAGEGLLGPVGHIDAPGGGHAPDWPHLDVEKAMRALKGLYDLVPQVRGKSVEWKEVEERFRAALSRPTTDERIAALKALSTEVFGDSTSYDKKAFTQMHLEFDAAVWSWKKRVEAEERKEIKREPVE